LAWPAGILKQRVDQCGVIGEQRAHRRDGFSAALFDGVQRVDEALSE
jgi:hypothetical protein